MNKVEESVGNLLLVLTICVVMVVVVVMAIAGFINYSKCNIAVETALEEIGKAPKEKPDKRGLRTEMGGTCDSTQPEPPAKAGTSSGTAEAPQDSFVDKLRCTVARTLEANTISFLFQIFSFAMIGVGAYLLSRSYSVLRATEKRASRLVERAQVGAADATSRAARILSVAENSPFGVVLCSSVAIVYQQSCVLRLAQAEPERISYLQAIRSSFRDISGMLVRGLLEHRGLSAECYGLCVNLIRGSLLNLNASGLAITRTEEFRHSGEDVARMLRTGEFVERHNNEMAELAGARGGAYTGNEGG